MRRRVPFDPATREHVLYIREPDASTPIHTIGSLCPVLDEEDVLLLLLCTHHEVFPHWRDLCTMVN